MNELTLKNIIRFITFIIIQVVILKRIQLGAPGFNLIHLFLYPLAILLLPINANRILVLFLSFFSGLLVDLFYDSPGVHAASATLLGYIRHFSFKWLEPRGGYGTAVLPTMEHLGSTWVISYVSIGMAVYISCYFSLQAFSIVFFFTILGKSVFSFLMSMIIVLVYLFVFQPKS